MNGLLHRLAARATGSALTLRADARLAYGASAPLPAEPPGPRLSEAAPAPSPENFRPNDSHPSSFTARQAAPPRMTDAVANDAPKAQQAPKPQTPAPARLLAASQPGLTPGDAQAPAVASLSPQRASLDAGLPAQAPAAPQPAQPSTATPAPPLSQRPDPSAFVQPSHPNRHAPAPPAAAPAPLLPRQSNAPPPASAHWPAASPATSPARAAAEATEVHVHIGRIEVTAMHEAAPPRKRPAAAAPASTPLDAYLAARQRERS
ncbi:MAG: hypothetical protein ACWA6Y_01265 [Polaromonas sp.]